MRKYKLVPVEPTEEMVIAAEDYMEFIDTTGEVWEAMLAAAPPASQDEALVEKVAQLLADGRVRNFGSGAGTAPRDVEWEYARAIIKMLEGDE